MNLSAIKTLEQVRYEAARAAVAQCETVAEAAYDLCITRYELTAILKRKGSPKRRNHKPGNIIMMARAAAVLLLVALTGCAVPTPRPAPPMPMRSTAPQASNLSSQSVMPSAQNVLVWDAPFTDPRLNAMLRYRIASRTNLSTGAWTYTTVSGTNRLALENRPAEFFTISRVDYAPATNVFITRKGF